MHLSGRSKIGYPRLSHAIEVVCRPYALGWGEKQLSGSTVKGINQRFYFFASAVPITRLTIFKNKVDVPECLVLSTLDMAYSSLVREALICYRINKDITILYRKKIHRRQILGQHHSRALVLSITSCT